MSPDTWQPDPDETPGDLEHMQDAAQGANEDRCGCWSCMEARSEPIQFMVLCPLCGNKRCPHANDHANSCTQSNAPGQSGSAYEHGSGDASAHRLLTEIIGGGDAQ